MIPVLTIFILKKLGFNVNLDALKVQLKEFLINLKSIFWALPIFFLFLSFTEFSKPEKIDSLTFEVYRKSKQIGTIQLQRQYYPEKIRYIIESAIEIDLLLNFDVEGREVADFVNGVMTYSSVQRKLNNRTKSQHQVVFENGTYHKTCSGSVEQLDLSEVHQNLVCLYYDEPNINHKVYCDNEISVSDVEKLSENVYKVQVTSGKYNIYHYQNGKCVKIEAYGPLYNVTLIAK